MGPRASMSCQQGTDQGAKRDRHYHTRERGHHRHQEEEMLLYRRPVFEDEWETQTWSNSVTGRQPTMHRNCCQSYRCYPFRLSETSLLKAGPVSLGEKWRKGKGGAGAERIEGSKKREKKSKRVLVSPRGKITMDVSSSRHRHQRKESAVLEAW